MLSPKKRFTAFTDSHGFWCVVETAGHFPAIYLQIIIKLLVTLYRLLLKKSSCSNRLNKLNYCNLIFKINGRWLGHHQPHSDPWAFPVE